MEQVLIERLREGLGTADPLGASRGEEAPGRRFAEIVSDLVGEVNRKQNAAEHDAEGLAKGEVGILDAVVSLNEADLSLRMIMQIRDRALDAYQRILRTI